VFQWSVSYMISPDAGNMGVKAIYVWCGMLAPTVAILYFFYPEVSPPYSFLPRAIEVMIVYLVPYSLDCRPNLLGA
jgi:hypothetical protein